MFNSEVTNGFQFSTGLTPLGDTDDFLSLLQSTPKAQALSATANPADLSVLRNINMSPSSSESSPSPPNHTQSGQTATGSGADHDTDQAALADDIFSNITMASRATRSANRDSQTGEPSAKRKLLDDLDEDSDEDAPQRKLQHTDPSNSKKNAMKRKSIGGQDDSRLQKRKEQNRAAQRAFRERKERHVKDLEDKVTILEAKTDTQAAENENLRELLTRLQQENLQLKQNQFSFTFQQPIASTSANPNPAQPYPTRQTSSDTNMTGPTANSSSSSSQSPLASNTLSNGHTNGNTLANSSTPQLTNGSASPTEFNLLETLGIGGSTPELNFSTGGLTGLTPPSSNNNSFTLMDSSFFGTSPPNNAGSDLNSFGDLGAFPPMPYQTIAASPMFTSYRDPTANPNAWSFGPNPSQSLSLNTYDELFGGAGPASSLSMSGLQSAGGDSNMASAIDDLMAFSFLPDMSNGAGGSQFGGLSPISHLPTPPSATGAGLSGTAATTPSQMQADPTDPMMVDPERKPCPKSREEFAARIQKMGASPFGPTEEDTPAATGMHGSGNGNSNGSADKEKMPIADSTKLNLDIGTAWRAVRQHPQFEECDIDELCAELTQKATCDGNTKVIEAQKIMDLVHSIPERAKQRKMSMATSTLMA